jgi:hypothetical protein
MARKKGQKSTEERLKTEEVLKKLKEEGMKTVEDEFALKKIEADIRRQKDKYYERKGWKFLEY